MRAAVPRVAQRFCRQRLLSTIPPPDFVANRSAYSSQKTVVLENNCSFGCSSPQNCSFGFSSQVVWGCLKYNFSPKRSAPNSPVTAGFAASAMFGCCSCAGDERRRRSFWIFQGHRCPLLVGLLKRICWVIPSLPGGSIIYQGYLFPKQGHL